jgi:hypothetical protein
MLVKLPALCDNRCSHEVTAESKLISFGFGPEEDRSVVIFKEVA